MRVFCLLQKLYRFINTVDLVSPHHSIKEIVANLREGQIASLFQKSVKKVNHNLFILLHILQQLRITDMSFVICIKIMGP